MHRHYADARFLDFLWSDWADLRAADPIPIP